MERVGNGHQESARCRKWIFLAHGDETRLLILLLLLFLRFEVNHPIKANTVFIQVYVVVPSNVLQFLANFHEPLGSHKELETRAILR